MIAPTQVLVTAEELLRRPWEYGSCELVRGEVVPVCPANPRHGGVASRVVQALCNYVDEHPSGIIFGCDTGIVVARDPDTVRGADAGYISFQRLRADDLPEEFLTVPPEIVVEVVGRDARWNDIQDKIDEYLAFGVDVVLIFDPRTRTVRVHRKGRPPLRLGIDDTLTIDDILPGFACPVRRIFRGSSRQP